MKATDVSAALAQARQAARDGNLDLAEALYGAMRADPAARLEAVSFLAFRHFAQARYVESSQYAAEALALRPVDRARLNLALSQFGAGDHAAAEHALSQLEDPLTGHAPLLRGALHLRRGETEPAVAAFETGLRRMARGQADLARLPPLLVQLFNEANDACAQYLRTLHRRQLDELQDAHGAPALARVRRAIEHFHERRETWQHDLQRPTFFYVPDLQPRQWFEREEFEWVESLESQAEAIGAEYRQVVARRRQSLKPYVTADQNAPPTTWGHLIETDNWLSLHLLKGGARVEPNASEMPVTLGALQAIDLPVCAGNAPEIFFSTLSPGAHIPPHHGLANFKLTAHLALDIPGDCAIRVGGEARSWEPGRCLVFDDSFLHEAWNRSARHRTVLIFDVWHPALTAIERAALSRLFVPIDASYNHRLSRLEAGGADGQKSR